MTQRRVSRRGFLKRAAVGAAAITIQPILSTRHLYAAGPGAPGRFMVGINSLGGNDGLSMVVPAHLSAYAARRPNINLVNPANLPSGASLLDLDGSWKLHYSLARTQSIWNDGDLHIVNKVSYPQPNQSHFTSQDIYSFGVRDATTNGDGRGWLGRFADAYCASPIEPLGVVSVGMGRRRDFEADTTTPLVLNDVAGFTINEDNERGQDGALRSLVAQQTLLAEAPPLIEPAATTYGTGLQAHELVARVRDGTAGWVNPGTYPNSTLGARLRTISQLLHGRAEFNTRVFYTGFSGFDTHAAQHAALGNGRHEQLMEELDGALGAFRDDIVAKGLWEDVVVVVISEFGRRTYENGSFGTDHGHGNCFLVAGGDVRGRFDAGSGMTGALTDPDIADGDTVPFQYDFRDLYGAIVQNHLGVSPAPLFPDPAYTPSTGDIAVV
jgi:uncharacterized protein (DUF1501 family)